MKYDIRTTEGDFQGSKKKERFRKMENQEYRVDYYMRSKRERDQDYEYMVVWVGDIRLYAESPPFEDIELSSYDVLKDEIILQATEQGIDPRCLVFHYDDKNIKHDKSEQYVVEYGDYDSRFIEFMVVNIGDIRLYAESPSFNDMELGSYDVLQTNIISQAREHGIDPRCLVFAEENERISVFKHDR